MANWSDAYYSDSSSFTTPFPSEHILSNISIEKPVLDIGCGYGRVLRYLQDKGFRNLYGFDISKSFVDKATSECPNAHIFVSDFNSFSNKINNQHFDLVLMMGVIEYILSDKEQDNLFKKVAEILAPNGIVLIETFILDVHAHWKQYLPGYFRTLHWGRFKNSKGFECHHQSPETLINIVSKYMLIDLSEPSIYKTWSGSKNNGHLFILKKK